MSSSVSRLDSLMRTADAAHSGGRWAECKSACNEILLVDPRNIPARILRGVVEFKSGDAATAAKTFEEVLLVDSGCAPAYQWLSLVYRQMGNLDDTYRCSQEAVRLSPGNPMTLHQLGMCQIDREEFTAAEGTFRKASSLAPNVPAIHHGMGLALRGQGRFPEAIGHLRQAVRFDPSFVAAWIILRELLTERYDMPGALECAKAIVRLQPHSSEANLWLARALSEQSFNQESAVYAKAAMRLEPDTPLAYSLLGSAYQVRGDLDQAELAFRKSIEMLPCQGSAYLSLAGNRRMTESDKPFLESMRSVLERGGLSLLHQSQLHFALGKALEDVGDYRESMGHYDEANRLSYSMKFGKKRFDSSAFSKLVDATISAYKEKRVETIEAPQNPSERPIFVLGMIRSGTTLVEQILTSHGEVGPAGEQPFWLEKFGASLRSGRLVPDDSAIRKLAQEYEALLNRIAPGKRRVVDKMPMNYQVAGLLHRAFPRAKIIHTLRSPLDTCISIYATPNRTPIDWGHDKANIAFAYEQYLRVADHWRRTLPAENFMELRYEDLVEDRERVTRDLVAFCNLEWDEACLTPEKNEREVVTPSVWQVRQPVYRTSIRRWKRFEPWLGALSKLMALEQSYR